MRFKNLLGLLAIGGAVAYAQKRRGGELTIDGFKNSFRSLIDNVKGKLEAVQSDQTGATTRATNDRGVGANIGASSVGSEYSTSGTSGYTGSQYGSNGIDRKY